MAPVFPLSPSVPQTLDKVERVERNNCHDLIRSGTVDIATSVVFRLPLVRFILHTVSHTQSDATMPLWHTESAPMKCSCEAKLNTQRDRPLLIC
jgi:hypothetical protein